MLEMRAKKTPLHIAAAEGRVDVAELLVKHGADVNARNNNNSTPLHLAANAGVAELLIRHGAEVNVRDKDGFTPLHWAADKGHLDVARLLLEMGADPNIIDKENKTPLDIAREKGHENVARVIEELVKSKTLSILDVEAPELFAGEWGKIAVRVKGFGKVSLTVEGDVEYVSPSP
jgi:ankyrin repeat protein